MFVEVVDCFVVSGRYVEGVCQFDEIWVCEVCVEVVVEFLVLFLNDRVELGVFLNDVHDWCAQLYGGF